MKDKNGIEIKTGMIVKVSGAYFKADNGLYYVDNSPGDPSWCGSDYSLHKISKAGKISTAKRHICFWPICVFVSDQCKTAEAGKWNAEHAEIEVVQISNMEEVKNYFSEKAANLEKTIEREVWDWGEESKVVQMHRAMKAHYEAVAATI
ncbi:MAG: hypothetical protein IKD01_05170 [Oscillospiraceae bacterium]|nr:hypothetical protein [Oscillospiraceae bacterium]